MGSDTRQPSWCLFPSQCAGAECRTRVCYANVLAGLAPMVHKIYLTIALLAFSSSKNIIPSQNRTSSCYFGELHLKIYVHVCVSKLQELKTPLHTDRANSINLLYVTGALLKIYLSSSLMHTVKLPPCKR